jgi:hypothetical protein
MSRKIESGKPRGGRDQGKRRNYPEENEWVEKGQSDDWEESSESKSQEKPRHYKEHKQAGYDTKDKKRDAKGGRPSVTKITSMAIPR